jgi:ATP-dependent Zn protease
MDPRLDDILIGVLPMLLLIGAWFLFMRHFQAPQGEYVTMQRRQTEALERIAAALEKHA